MKSAALGLFAALSLAAACVGGQRSQVSPGVHDQYQLQADELMSLGEDATLYDVIERLRRRWLEPRSVDPALPSATDQIGVYAGTRPLGGITELRYIQVRDVVWARFIQPREAEALYGPGHASGVIVVELK